MATRVAGLTIGKVARNAGLEAGVKAATVSFKEGRARVLYDPAAVDAARHVTTIEQGGYRVTSTA